MTKLNYPLDTTTQSLHSIWLLFTLRGIKVSKMTISRRLGKLATLGLLRKLSNTNPTFYEIAEDQEGLVKKIVYFKNTEEFMKS